MSGWSSGEIRITGNPGDCDLVINVAVSMACGFIFLTDFMMFGIILKRLIVELHSKCRLPGNENRYTIMLMIYIFYGFLKTKK